MSKTTARYDLLLNSCMHYSACTSCCSNIKNIEYKEVYILSRSGSDYLVPPRFVSFLKISIQKYMFKPIYVSAIEKRGYVRKNVSMLVSKQIEFIYFSIIILVI